MKKKNIILTMLTSCLLFVYLTLSVYAQTNNTDVVLISPSTGDLNPLILVALIAASLVMVIALVVISKKRK